MLTSESPTGDDGETPQLSLSGKHGWLIAKEVRIPPRKTWVANAFICSVPRSSECQPNILCSQALAIIADDIGYLLAFGSGLKTTSARHRDRTRLGESQKAEEEDAFEVEEHVGQVGKEKTLKVMNIRIEAYPGDR